MTTLRQQILRHKRFAAFVLAVALLYRIVVPVGFMPDASSGHIQISICTGFGPMTMTMAMPGAHGGKSDTGHGHKPAMSCPFAGLSSPGLARTAEYLIVAAFAYIMAVGLEATKAFRIERTDQLRPPLRGPPSIP